MKDNIKELFRYPVLILFCGFIVLFSIWDSTINNRKTSELENRDLAQKPVMTKANLLAKEDDKKFSYLYEQYVNDQFVGRDNWISLKSRAEAVLLKTENNSILYGGSGTMYQKFYTMDAEQYAKNNASIAQFMARHPGLVSVMIVPSADMISPDAPNAPFVDETPYFDEMAKTFSASGEWIDLREVFAAHANEQLYYRTDHHWTTYGAYLAYRAYCESVGLTPAFDPAAHTLTRADGFYGTLYSKSKLYSAAPDTLDYYSDLDNRLILTQSATKADAEAAHAAGVKDEVLTLYNLEKLSVRDKYAMFIYSNNGFSKLSGTGSGKVLVIKDSYANCFVPFLTEDYAQIDIVDLRSLNTNMDTVIEENGYDRVLILYNFQSYQKDTGLVKLNLFGANG